VRGGSGGVTLPNGVVRGGKPPASLPDYPEPTRRALARNLLRRSLRLKRGENLIIETWSATLPWAQSMVLEARILGARPLLWLEDEPTYWKALKEAPASFLGRVGSHEFAALKEAHAFIFLSGPRLDGARGDPRPLRLERREQAVDHEFFRLIQKYRVRTVRWDLGRTDETRAQRWGVPLDRWRRELIDATSFDPRALLRDGHRVALALQRGREVEITHPNGTHLRLRLAGRKPVVDDGVLDEADVRAGNVWTVVPSGVTTVTIDETYAEGTFVGNTPAVMFVQDRETPYGPATWTFGEGRLAKYEFNEREEEFLRLFPKLPAGKDRPGILSIGLNPRISSIPLLLDQERGMVNLAIGRNSFFGGKTRVPRFTAHQAVRGATLTVDGRTLVDEGRLTIGPPSLT
jgi:leucyl aminopeptidase (aminopeptidase T)